MRAECVMNTFARVSAECTKQPIPANTITVLSYYKCIDNNNNSFERINMRSLKFIIGLYIQANTYWIHYLFAFYFLDQ